MKTITKVWILLFTVSVVGVGLIKTWTQSENIENDVSVIAAIAMIGFVAFKLFMPKRRSKPKPQPTQNVLFDWNLRDD